MFFRPLSRVQTRQIAAREVEAVRERIGIKQRGLVVQVEEDALDWLAERGYDPYYGARSLRRAVERYAVTALAEAIVRAEPSRGSRLVVRVRGEGLVVEVERGGVAEARELEEAVMI